MSIRSILSTLMGVCVAGFLLAGPAVVAERGTRAEAEAMVKKAVAYVRANGRAKAAEEFTTGSGFKDRDLYISYYDLTGKVIGHGANAKLVGKDLIGMKDPDGKLLNKMLVDLAKEKGKGWSDEFKFRNPVTDEIQRRKVYVERVGDTFVGTGIFLE
jgi:signal transduction histidine kinase